MASLDHRAIRGQGGSQVSAIVALLPDRHDSMRLGVGKPLEQDWIAALKTDVLAPMPNASVTAAMQVKPGLLRRRRPA